jgi:hypothetical protein
VWANSHIACAKRINWEKVQAMPIAPFTGQSWLFVPPLDLPLALRLENGRFGALRPKPLPAPPPCATTQIIPADDP